MIKMFQKQAKKPKIIQEMADVFNKSEDFFCYVNMEALTPFWVCYHATLIDLKILHQHILPYIQYYPLKSVKELRQLVPIEGIVITTDENEIKNKILQGYVAIQLHKQNRYCALIRADRKEARQVSLPEVEFSVVGPKESFVESIEVNINLIRKRLPIPNLKIKMLKAGKLSKTKIAVLYVENIVEKENVQTVLQRISDIDFDHISDSSFISQLIVDNTKSPFPQLLDTERPDRVSSVLVEGKVAILTDGSPHALIGPTTLVEFFSSFEDYFLNWQIASFFRIIRLFAVLFSILVTPTYVAVLTYHYELIPTDLLATLITSRREVPLPPILEAFFLELTIELLREAGARLPTKVGQTIGIVGGIVIGTASVEAGLTSNVLLIIVALAALASFTTPVYNMGNTIRLIRFPFLLLAELWGLLGVVMCFCLFLTHLIRLTSLGRPFLEPIYPPRIRDLRDSFVRLPFHALSKRPIALRTEKPIRFDKKKANQKKDIDE